MSRRIGQSGNNAETGQRQSNAARSSRRRVLKALAAAGIGTAVFHRAVAAFAHQSSAVTPDMIRQAEWICGIELSDEDREITARMVKQSLRNYRLLREVPLANSVAPALHFQPAPAAMNASDIASDNTVRMIEAAPPVRPDSDEDLAFLPLTELAALIRTRQVTSSELTRIYLDRLRQYDPVLRCVVTYTDDLALAQAERADREIAAGRYRGPLHGIPWGAKDLISWPGYTTTWGATPYKDQTLDTKATVAHKLEEAGAVMLAKLSLGALAQGDLWFKGRTRNPWNPKQGSSGSSAGSACATSAGLVGFALGSETLGSIVSPCRRCGVSGLRPTFGRVSRYGCMSLSWSMDKLGPIARSVEDCALIFAAIHGSDGLDPTAVDRPFSWPSRRDLRSLRVGYVERPQSDKPRPELDVLTELGVTLVPITLPKSYPVSALTMILNTEAAAVFDDLTRRGITEGLNTWPRAFRQGQFVPAVEYLRANRVRTLVMREMEECIKDIDVYVGGSDLVVANLTGHPTAVLPDGFRTVDGIEVPTAVTFTGKLFGETELLGLAHAYQQARGFHLKRPPMDRVTPENAEE